ncbi:MAG TPA: hypothetical protein PK919_03385 [Candidatus Aminicenantes bacterium]|nr:hypothetical protein [Candidatus Aminicenantes bacterium]
MKKFKLNWQSVAVGLVLCAVLGVFVGSKIADPQIVSRTTAQQRIATVNELYEQNVALDAKVAAVEEHLARIERKIDDLNNDTRMMMKALGRLEAGKTGK